jgi:hypothetical protein
MRVTAKKKYFTRPFPHTAHKGITVYGTTTIYQTILITKMIVRSRPFSKLENAFPLEILNHFTNWKGTFHSGQFFELKKDCP